MSQTVNDASTDAQGALGTEYNNSCEESGKFGAKHTVKGE